MFSGRVSAANPCLAPAGKLGSPSSVHSEAPWTTRNQHKNPEYRFTPENMRRFGIWIQIWLEPLLLSLRVSQLCCEDRDAPVKSAVLPETALSGTPMPLGSDGSSLDAQLAGGRERVKGEELLEKRNVWEIMSPYSSSPHAPTANKQEEPANPASPVSSDGFPAQSSATEMKCQQQQRLPNRCPRSASARLPQRAVLMSNHKIVLENPSVLFHEPKSSAETGLAPGGTKASATQAA